MKKKLLTLTVALTTCMATAQIKDDNSLLYLYDESHPCLSIDEYKTIELEINKNITLLGLNNLHKSQKTAAAVTSLSWPLKQAANSADCGYYYISAFVDLDATAAVKDWNCGARCYNGHRGIDIVAWPFIWDKMDNNLVEVIAAASGTIVAKVDGNPDRVCNGVGGGSTSNNYITIQHADGSQALYAHMKTGSMTIKGVGQTVVTGEYLAIPGSSGQSTGQHLHFEVRSLGTFASYIDPNFGTCNAGIGSSWWAAQKPYTEPQIIKLSTHSDWSYYGTCPNTHDTTFYADTFISNPGTQGIFHVATRQPSVGSVWDFKILNPDGSVFTSWTYTSTMALNTSILAWPKTLPTTPGVYTFEGTFNSITCSKNFTIQSTLDIENPINNSSPISVYPNPAQHVINVIADAKLLGSVYKVYDNVGKVVLSGKINSTNTIIELDNLLGGIYLFSVGENLKQTFKVIKK